MVPVPINKLLVLTLALIKFLIPFLLIAPAFELQRDEYLYFEQGQHPALGYLENPPLLSWLGTISSWLGGSECTIRLWPALFGALTLILTCLITARFGGRTFAQFIAGIGLLTGAFLRVHILFQPNILDIFFWTLSLYFLLRFVQEKNQNDLLWLMISLVLGWWSKSSIVFIAVAILIGLLASRYRTLLTEKRTLILAGLGLLLVLPNVYWQYSHNWPLIHHMKELRETQLVYVNPIDFIKDQLLLLFPVLITWIAGLTWLIKNKSYRLFAWIYFSVIVLLILGSGKNYYSLGVYPLLLAAGGYAWEKWTMRKTWLRYAITFLVILFTIPFIPLALPFREPPSLVEFYKKYDIGKTGLLKWEDQRDHELPQDFADMLGWKELAEKTERLFLKMSDSTRHHTIIYCRNYGQAGSLKFYGKEKQFKEKLISDNGSFLLWIDEDINFKHLLFVGRRLPDKDDEVFQHFEKVSILDSVTNRLSRQLGDKIIFFENADSVASRLATTGLKELRQQFRH